MSTEFALDLKVARRRAGLSQSDCAHLLGVHTSKISALEHGRGRPNLTEICALSLLYGKSFESLFATIFTEVRVTLKERYVDMPDCPRQWLGRFNRQNTLSKLAARLEAESQNHGTA